MLSCPPPNGGFAAAVAAASVVARPELMNATIASGPATMAASTMRIARTAVEWDCSVEVLMASAGLVAADPPAGPAGWSQRAHDGAKGGGAAPAVAADRYGGDENAVVLLVVAGRRQRVPGVRVDPDLNAGTVRCPFLPLGGLHRLLAGDGRGQGGVDVRGGPVVGVGRAGVDSGVNPVHRGAERRTHPLRVAIVDRRVRCRQCEHGRWCGAPRRGWGTRSGEDRCNQQHDYSLHADHADQARVERLPAA